MCKLGDIILINNYKSNGVSINQHSFVVVDDENGEIQGLAYDLVCNVMSSFKNEQQKTRKMKYPGNFELLNKDSVTNPDNGKDGYIKAEQLFYFKKDNIEFQVIGSLKEDAFDRLIQFIGSLERIEEIVDNLK